MNYLFDTNIVLAFLRRNNVAQAVAHILSLTDDNRVYISIVSVGELWSIANQNNWASPRRRQLQTILDDYIQLAISDDKLIVQYAEIDAFSQNRLPGRSSTATARNMGKNDLWIAASASLEGASLITTDKDFDHLHNQFLDVIWIDPNQYN
ncbi:MAG: PIN domain-containing protein [Bacteroidetes bacterium]|nr:PIN domain-containing protein [Fibrella sp.]